MRTIIRLFLLSSVLFMYSAMLLFAADSVPCRKSITLGGEVGQAAHDSIMRFHSEPYDSLAWIRADLTGETVSQYDDKWGHVLRRPYKNYSGDISGRFIEIMALNAGDCGVSLQLRDLLAEVPKHQRQGGYFSASGIIDWQQPIDFNVKDGGRMMPCLWGNSRLLCGLVAACHLRGSVESCRTYNNPALLESAKKLGDFYVGILPRFTDPERISEYTGGDTYAAGYVTCYFPAMEGLVKLHALTGEKKYLDTAVTMAAFYKSIDKLPIDHSHGMLCNQVSLLLLYDVTKDASYLERVEKRWTDLVDGGYINPAGGILEKCRVKNEKDEGCAIVDWLRLNLQLAKVTGKSRYWAMAERTLHNHLLQNQTSSGGFGHRRMLCDDNGVLGLERGIQEATWCCTLHGQLGFVNLRNHLVTLTAEMLTCNFALNFGFNNSAGKVVSEILSSAGAGEVMRQRIRVEGRAAMTVRIRKPLWADAVTGVDTNGNPLALYDKDGYLSTDKPVSDVVFIYKGGVYAENRHCVRLADGPKAGAPCVFGYGPKIIAAAGRDPAMPDWPVSIEKLHGHGLAPLNPAMRTNVCSFVIGGVQ